MDYRKIMLIIAVVVIFFSPPSVCGGGVGVSQPLVEADLYFVDVHSQVDEDVSDLGLIIRCIYAAGVYRTILAARSGRKPGEIADFARQNPQRIVLSVRTKSDAFNKNPANWLKYIEAQVNSRRFQALVEMLLSHAQKGKKTPRSGRIRKC